MTIEITEDNVLQLKYNIALFLLAERYITWGQTEEVKHELEGIIEAHIDRGGS